MHMILKTILHLNARKLSKIHACNSDLECAKVD